MGVFLLLRIIKDSPPSAPPPKEIISYSATLLFTWVFSLFLYHVTCKFHVNKCEFIVLKGLLTVVGDIVCLLQDVQVLLSCSVLGPVDVRSCCGWSPCVDTWSWDKDIAPTGNNPLLEWNQVRSFWSESAGVWGLSGTDPRRENPPVST